jgi:hypothetical protein
MPDQTRPEATPAPRDVADIRREIIDALYLLDYAVANGVKTKDGNPLPQDTLNAIKGAAGKAGVMPGGPAGDFTAQDWAIFEMAYYDLTTALSPVTAETLRNTQSVPCEKRTWWEFFAGESAATRFTRVLWAVTLSLAAFIIWGGWYIGVKSAEDANVGNYNACRVFLDVTTPWAYGGLGACVYLLRSAHTYIYQRCFDVRRKSEYFNRILLGAVAGGAIILFASQYADDDGNVVQLSSAALGFLAGYNTDFLFSALERVAQALLPKIGLDSLQKPTGGTQPVDLNDLAKRMDAATGAEKEFYRSLIAQLTGARKPPAQAPG